MSTYKKLFDSLICVVIEFQHAYAYIIMTTDNGEVYFSLLYA